MPVSTKFSSENWLDAQVEHIDGEWVATIPNTGNVGDFVHIRTIVSDYGSSQAEQITMRAYVRLISCAISKAPSGGFFHVKTT